MALATISETLSLPASGSAATLRGTRVRLRLVAADSGEAVAYSASVTTVSEAWQKVANDGSYSFTGVRPNTGSSGDQITDPAETVYELSIVYPSGTVTTRYLDVPDSTGPHAPADIEVNNPNTIRRWRSTDLYDFDATAADADGEVPVWNNTNSEFVPGTVPTAGITDAAVTTAKINDAAVTTAKLNDDAVTTAKITDANVTTAKLAAEAVTSAKVDPTVEVVSQGRLMARRKDARYHLNALLTAFFPLDVVYIGDSHGELGVTENLRSALCKRYGIRYDATCGEWDPAQDGFGLQSNSGAVASTAGPMEYAAEIDTGDYIEWGDGTDQIMGFRFYGVGSFTFEVFYDSVLQSTDTATLAAGEEWASGLLTSRGNVLRVTATADGSVAWGCFTAHDNYANAVRLWNISHSGYNWANIDPDTHSETWDLLDAINPDVAILAMATNETNATTYRDGTIEAITRLRSNNAECTIVLFFPHLASASGNDEDWWDDAHAHMLDICRDYDCIPADLYALTGDLSTSDPNGLISGDLVHLSAAGNAFASAVMHQALTGTMMPVYRPADASGTFPSESLTLRNIDGNTSANVSLLAGAILGDIDQLMVTNPARDTFLPVAAGDPTNPAHMLTEGYADARYQTGIWLGGQDLYPVTGSPSVLPGLGGSISNHRLSAIWGLADSTTEGLGANLVIPSHWSTFALTLVVVHGSGSGNVAYRCRYALVTLGSTVNTAVAGGLVTVANGTQYDTGIVSLLSGVSCTPGQILDFRVQREGADAADTFSGDHGVMGVIVSRAS